METDLVTRLREIARFPISNGPRADIACGEAADHITHLEAVMGNVRTWVKGLPHDLESCEQVLADIDSALDDALPVFDESLDVGGGCEESCEVYADEDEEFDLNA